MNSTQTPTTSIGRLDVTAANGVRFRAVCIPAGTQRPNHPRVLPYDEVVVEFYDRRHDFTPDGQFVSDYFVSTLRAGYPRIQKSGLDLHSGVPSWTIDGATMARVISWLEAECNAANDGLAEALAELRRYSAWQGADAVAHATLEQYGSASNAYENARELADAAWAAHLADAARPTRY